MIAPALPSGAIAALTRRLPGGADPLAAYRRLTGGAPHTFLLESADRTTQVGDRSLIGVRTALHLTADLDRVVVEALSPNGDAALDWLTARTPGRRSGRRLTVPIERHAVRDETARFRQPSPLDLLRSLAFGPEVRDEASPFGHLLVGMIGYDAIDYFETLPRGGPDPLEQPVVEFWIPDRLVVVDHVHRARTLIATAWGGPGYEERYHDAGRELDRLVGALATPELPAALEPVATADLDAVAVDQTDQQYAEVVSTVQGRLEAGDAYQIVPSRTFSVPCGDPLGAYAELRRANPSPYLFYLVSPDRVLLGASPETCLRVDGTTRRVSVVPIAGTAPRGRAADGSLDPDLDCRREIALRQDPKESAEHLMLVDLARNDVARISVPGTRVVSRLLTTERYRHVMHLVSEVSGTLVPGVDALEAYAATMNMGTLVGAPKVMAASLLRQIEPSRRGWYGGGVGYLRGDGTLETAIIIRSAVVRDGTAHVRAGAGVVLDSDPAAEARETERKARAVVEAILRAEAAVHA